MGPYAYVTPEVKPLRYTGKSILSDLIDHLLPLLIATLPNKVYLGSDVKKMCILDLHLPLSLDLHVSDHYCQ